MQFKQGTGVFTADDRKVGTIDRVVMDPRTKELSHVVVRKGVLFTEDKVVPLVLIARADKDRIVLRGDIGDLDALPQFEETDYIPLVESTAGPESRSTYDVAALYWYPPVGVAAWNYPGYPGPGPIYVTRTERHIPEGTVALKEGSKVISNDDHHVGNVERVFTDSRTDRVTHFVISQGLILTERKLIPVAWVSTVMEDEVHLSVDRQLLDRLPRYEERLASAIS